MVIELYTSGDIALKLLLIDAKKNGIILKKDGMYNYADTILGATDDSVLLFFKMPSNKRILDQIKFETYPEYASVSDIENKIEEVESAPTKVDKKTSGSKGK